MTKQQLAELEMIQGNLMKGIQFIKSPNVEFCMSASYPNEKVYSNKAGRHLNVMNKEIGSDLCCIYNALRSVTLMILKEKKIKLPKY